MLKFNKTNNIYEISFGFKNFEVDEKIVLFIINFYYSLYYNSGLNTNKNKFFVKNKKGNKIKDKNPFDFVDKIQIMNIPCINIKNSNKNLYF